jgi:hypothetical protein
MCIQHFFFKKSTVHCTSSVFGRVRLDDGIGELVVGDAAEVSDEKGNL